MKTVLDFNRVPMYDKIKNYAMWTANGRKVLHQTNHSQVKGTDAEINIKHYDTKTLNMCSIIIFKQLA